MAAPMSFARSSLVCALALPLACGPGCAGARRATGPGPGAYDPPALLPAGRLATDVLWEQRLVARWDSADGGGEQAFDAAVQKLGDELLVLGLSPLGEAGFVLRLSDGEISFENRSGRELSFPPDWIVLDVQRVFYPWLVDAPAGEDGRREGVVGGERVLERWSGGRLIERRFERSDGPAGAVVVRYEWSPADELAPGRATLTDERRGYELVIETYAESRLGDAR